jgi:hypothetical protein
MHKSFEHADVSGIIKPGEIYIFCDNEERKLRPESVDYIYTIRSEMEILPALDMEMINISSVYRFRKYLGSEKISEDCHQFKMLCYNELGETTVISQYLQRVSTFEEKFKRHLEEDL